MRSSSAKRWPRPTLQTSGVEPPFWPGTNWKHALVVSVDQRMPGYDQLDERAAWFYEAVVISKGMLTQTPGVGQRYIAAYKDKDGKWLDGGKTYKLHVPANPPAKQFWSATAYDEGTRQMVVTEQGRPDISSRKKDIVKNADGSIDVYFGPKAPAGQETNWVQTVPGKGWFTYFRFYGPTEAFFDKSWALPDIEQVEGRLFFPSDSVAEQVRKSGASPIAKESNRSPRSFGTGT